MESNRFAAIRATLEKHRDELTHQLEELGAPPESSSVQMSVDEGFADSGQATAERSETLSLVEELRTMYADVLAALGRLDDGTYGACERCGRAISIERLEALPAVRLCVDCKQATG